MELYTRDETDVHMVAASCDLPFHIPVNIQGTWHLLLEIKFDPTQKLNHMISAWLETYF